MEIKWYGTAGISFQSGDKTILFDPFFPMNSELPAPDLAELAACGEIFITHGHFDHLLDIPKVVASGGGPVHCSGEAAETLRREGVREADIKTIKPGDRLERGPFRITIYRSKHIRFDGRLIARTVFNRRVISYRRNLGVLIRENFRYPKGEMLAYFLEVEKKRILHLGSLNLDEQERYPEKIDLLTLPYQGRSDLESYTMKFIERLRPRKIYLHHFDDSFPPISSPIEVQPFIRSLKKNFPKIGVITPRVFRSVQY